MSKLASSSHLGTGWGFPPAFGDGGVSVDMVSDEEDVHQGLQILFATRVGERPMRETFGCSLEEFTFRHINHTLINRIQTYVRDAILKYETRIRLLELSVSQNAAEPGRLDIRLDYVVLAVNSRFNMVFPFYQNEATSLGA